jgi:DNA-binding transcriptional MerR regulator/uncharacterized protein (DUF433 family)
MPTILAFTSPQVQRLTGLTARRLVYWDETGVYHPTYKDERAYRAYRRIYTFRDVVSLRTLVALRDRFGISLDELRKTGEHLMQFTDDPWTKRFWVENGRVYFHLSELSEHPIDRHGQTTYLDLGPIWDEVERETAGWTERDPGDIGQLSRHRHVQHNQWVIKGTRIPTSAVWSFHAAGYDTAGIIEQYPTLHAADVVAAIAHERQLRSEAA